MTPPCRPGTCSACEVDALTMEQTVALAEQAIRQHERLLIGVVNAAKIAKLNADPVLRDSLLEADVLLADGQSVVWASRLLGQPLPERVAGIDLFEELLGVADRDHLRVFLLGATPEVLARVEQEIATRWPGVVIAGSRDGYFTEDEADEVAEQIAGCAPDLLFLGHDHPEEGDLPRTVRRPARRTRAARRRRLVRRARRRHRTRAAGLAALRHGVGLPGRPGAASPLAALPGHQHRVPRPARRRARPPARRPGPTAPARPRPSTSAPATHGRTHHERGLQRHGSPSSASATSDCRPPPPSRPAASRSSASTSTRRRSRPWRTARSRSSSPTSSVAVSGAVAMGRLTATTETPEADAYIIAVPDAVQGRPPGRPVATSGRPTEQIAPQLRGGEIVILESTSPPGTTESVSRGSPSCART